MQVFRWQDQDGQGPYVGHGLFYNHNTNNGRPPPQSDGIGHVHCSMVCGFASKAKADEWFTTWERRTMRKHGLMLTVHNVPDEDVIVGRKQVVFVPDTDPIPYKLHARMARRQLTNARDQRTMDPSSRVRRWQMCNGYTHTVVITIGRKIGNKEMDDAKWAGFKRAVLHDFLACGGQILQRPKLGNMRAHDQVGVWDGLSEPAATVVGFISGYRNIATLRQLLAAIAAEYEQQAIGCIVTLGTDHLVCP